MVPQPDDPKAQNEEIYDQLISLIENTQGRLAPIIVSCDDEALRQRIILRYESEARQVNIRPYRIVLGHEPSLRAGLETLTQQEPHLQQGGKAVFTVTGAELLLRVKLHPQDEQSELDKFFGYLQWTREGLQEFRYPIVLWVTPRIFQDMRRRAPDFWSWRKAVLRFVAESPSVNRFAAPDLRFSPESSATGQSSDEALPPLEELQAEIAEITDHDPDAPGLATLYTLLGQVYAQRIGRGNAENLELEREHAIAAFQQAITRYQVQNYQPAEMWALTRLGNFFESQSRYLEAIACHQQSLEIAQEIEDRQGEASSLGSLGTAYEALGQYQRAINFLQQPSEIFREIGNRYGEAISLNNLGNAHRSLGQYQRAINFLQQSLEIFREIGNRHGEASSLGSLGSNYRLLGQYQQAIDFLQQSLEIQREIGDRRGEASSLNNLGNIYYSLGQYQREIDFLQQSLEIQREIGDRQGEATSFNNLGIAYDSLEQHPQAIDFLQQSLEIRREIGDLQGEASSLFNLARTFAKLGKLWEAVQHYQYARQIFQSLGLKHRVELCDTAIDSLNSILPAE